MKCKYWFSFISFRGSVLFPAIPLLLFVTNFPWATCDSYFWYNCDNSTNFTVGSTYYTNLNLVMNDLIINAAQSSGFNTSSHGLSPNKVYGLLQYGGDKSEVKCSDCAVEANSSIRQRCSNSIGERIWLDDCFMRYHNYNFISTLDDDGATIANGNSISGDAFVSTISNLLSNLSDEAYIPANKAFAVVSANYNATLKLYGLVQCWRDISVQDCRTCLTEARTNLSVHFTSRIGAQVQYGSCKLIYDTHLFWDIAQSPSPSPSPFPEGSPSPLLDPSLNTVNGTSSTTSKGRSSLILPIVLGGVGAIIMALVFCLILLRKCVKSVVSWRSGTTTNNQARNGLFLQEPHQFVFTLKMLEEATENFHEKNKLGEGGFGVVYKGLTRDGNEIAVKRLLARSAQSEKEFMNEVKLVANVRHKNLAKLLGCCAQGDERLLVYEYFPNKSLDIFLFGKFF